MATPTFNVNADKIRAVTYSDKVRAAEQEQLDRSRKVRQYETEAYTELLNLLFRYTANGNFDNQSELFFSRYDRYGTSMLTPNVEHSGLTFFTRPKLPLTRGNLQLCPTLTPLDTYDPQAYAFAIRCWLDTKFSLTKANQQYVLQCPFFDIKSAFNIPLSNACVAQSGWPDPFIQTFTTTGGFFQEDQTFPIGSDRLRKTYDLTFTFKETQGAPILSMLYTWYEAMSCLCEGSMVAYAEDIDAQRMCYTCSIYRFLLDPSKTHITHYAKATGCFPKAPPVGALFNQSKGEINISAAQEVSVPFVVNKVEYDDPRILLDFNLLVSRYCPDISTYPILRPESYNNFKGRPFVISTARGLELAFREENEQPFYDERDSKMMATTRERFELATLFYPGAKTMTDKDGKQRVITKDGQRIIQGNETRHDLLAKGNGANIEYATPPDTEHDKTQGLGYYTGKPVDDTIRELLKGRTKIDVRKGVVSDATGTLVNPDSPVFVTGNSMGEFDQASINRANVKDENGDRRGNRDIVDAGTNPNPSSKSAAPPKKTVTEQNKKYKEVK